MAKKSFTSGMDGLLGGAKTKTLAPKKANKEEAIGRGRPKTNFKEVTKSSQAGTKVNETRATFIVNEDQLEKIKALAYYERTSIKDVLFTAIENHLKANKSEVIKAVGSYKAKA